MANSSGQKITEKGHFITVNGERIKVGILDKKFGNARVFRNNGCTEIKGIFALVQWYKREEPYEKIAYNVTAKSVEKARKEMTEWMPKLQYPEYRESSMLIEILSIARKNNQS